MAFSLIVFDLDDTIYPESMYVKSGFCAVGQWLEESRNIQGFAERALELYKQGVRGHIFDAVLKQIGIANEEMSVLVPKMVRHYREHLPQITLYEDAKWALSYAGSKAPLGLLTDGYAVAQRQKVNALGIEKLFAAIVYSDDLGRDCWKPSPAPYLKLMSTMDVKGADCIYIGDNPQKDFITARKLGWKTVHIHRKGAEYATVVADGLHAAEYQISDLRQLESIL